MELGSVDMGLRRGQRTFSSLPRQLPSSYTLPRQLPSSYTVPYGYKLDLDFIRFCDGFYNSSSNANSAGAPGLRRCHQPRTRRVRRQPRKSCDSLLAVRTEDRVLRHEDRVLRPEDRVLRPEGRVLGPEDRVLRPDDRVLRPEDRVLRPEDRVLRPEDRVLRPEDRVLQLTSADEKADSEKEVSPPAPLLHRRSDEQLPRPYRSRSLQRQQLQLPDDSLQQVVSDFEDLLESSRRPPSVCASATSYLSDGAGHVTRSSSQLRRCHSLPRASSLVLMSERSRSTTPLSSACSSPLPSEYSRDVAREMSETIRSLQQLSRMDDLETSPKPPPADIGSIRPGPTDDRVTSPTDHRAEITRLKNELEAKEQTISDLEQRMHSLPRAERICRQPDISRRDVDLRVLEGLTPKLDAPYRTAVVEGRSEQNLKSTLPQLQDTSTSCHVPTPPQLQDASTSCHVPTPPQLQDASTSCHVLTRPQLQDASTSCHVLTRPQLQDASTSCHVLTRPQLQDASTSCHVLTHPQLQDASTSCHVLTRPQLQDASTSCHVLTREASTDVPAAPVGRLHPSPVRPPVLTRSVGVLTDLSAVCQASGAARSCTLQSILTGRGARRSVGVGTGPRQPRLSMSAVHLEEVTPVESSDTSTRKRQTSRGCQTAPPAESPRRCVATGGTGTELTMAQLLLPTADSEADLLNRCSRGSSSTRDTFTQLKEFDLGVNYVRGAFSFAESSDFSVQVQLDQRPVTCSVSTQAELSTPTVAVGPVSAEEPRPPVVMRTFAAQVRPATVECGMQCRLVPETADAATNSTIDGATVTSQIHGAITRRSPPRFRDASCTARADTLSRATNTDRPRQLLRKVKSTSTDIVQMRSVGCGDAVFTRHSSCQTEPSASPLPRSGSCQTEPSSSPLPRSGSYQTDTSSSPLPPLPRYGSSRIPRPAATSSPVTRRRELPRRPASAEPPSSSCYSEPKQRQFGRREPPTPSRPALQRRRTFHLPASPLAAAGNSPLLPRPGSAAACYSSGRDGEQPPSNGTAHTVQSLEGTHHTAQSQDVTHGTSQSQDGTHGTAQSSDGTHSTVHSLEGTHHTDQSQDGTHGTAQSQDGTHGTAQSSDGTHSTVPSLEGTRRTAQSQDGTRRTAQSLEGTHRIAQLPEGTRHTDKSPDSTQCTDKSREDTRRTVQPRASDGEHQDLDIDSVRSQRGRSDGDRVLPGRKCNGEPANVNRSLSPLLSESSSISQNSSGSADEQDKQATSEDDGKQQSPSAEVLSALRTLNGQLSASDGSCESGRGQLVAAMVQGVWFDTAGGRSADPIAVEALLDAMESLSHRLLQTVVNMTDDNGNTALHYAVSHGNFAVVAVLLDSRVCDVQRQNKAGYTCLMLLSLASIGDRSLVVRRLLINADVNVKAVQHGQTALMLAASHGKEDMVELLLEAGADVNIQDNDGSTALMCAAEHGHAGIVRCLLAVPECSTQLVDGDGCTALQVAMEAGHRDVGLLLYAHGTFSRAASRAGSPRGSQRHASGGAKRPASRGAATPAVQGTPQPARRSNSSLH